MFKQTRAVKCCLNSLLTFNNTLNSLRLKLANSRSELAPYTERLSEIAV